MATKHRFVTLEGTDALTITEARALIRAAIIGRHFIDSPKDQDLADDACDKVAQGLIAAGQDRELVQSFLNGCVCAAEFRCHRK